MAEENDTEETEEDSSGSPNAKRISPEVWAEVERLFESGEANGAELTARYGISSSTLSKRWKTRGLTFNSKSPSSAAATAAAIAAAAPKPVRTWAEMREERIEETKRRAYEIHNAVSGMMGIMLREFVRGTAAPHQKIADLKALNLLAKTNEISRIGRYALLDVVPEVVEEDLPGILIEDISSDELEQIKKEQEEGLDPDDDGEIIIEGDEDIPEAI